MPEQPNAAPPGPFAITGLTLEQIRAVGAALDAYVLAGNGGPAAVAVQFEVSRVLTRHAPTMKKDWP